MRSATLRLLLALGALLGALVLASCGSDEPETTGPEPVREAKPEDFPSAQGKTLGALQEEAPEGPVLAPAVAVLRPVKDNRFGFALFDRARKQVRGASVAIYTARTVGGPVSGPYPARDESLAVKPQFASRTTTEDPDAAKSVYVADLPFRRKGKYIVMAIARLDDRLVSSSAIQVVVGGPGPPPVGARAVKIDTPTVQDVGGDVEQIDTRIPPGTMHDVNFADVLGKKPIVLVFATPQLCQSRVCGPIVDAVEQVKAEYGDRVAFIHMEIYNDNKLEAGFRPQVRAWGLPSEPWVFAIDKRGRIAAELEGAASVREIQAATQKAVRD